MQRWVEFPARLLIAFFVFFVVTSYTQTPKQLKYYAERIEFGEIEVKRNALFELRNFETESASRVAIPALRDISEIVRATATHTLVFLPKGEAVAHLLPLLEEKSVYVRRETAYALGKVGSKRANRRLIELLKRDKSREVKTACAVALGEIGDISAAGALAEVIKRKRRKKDVFLRRAAARSIGKIAQTMQKQVVTTTTPESFLPEKYKKIRRPRYGKLVEAFPVFSTANQFLIKILKNVKESNDVRREAAFALGEIGDASSIQILKAQLNSKDYYLAEICEESLRKVIASVNFANSDGVPQT